MPCMNTDGGVSRNGLDVLVAAQLQSAAKDLGNPFPSQVVHCSSRQFPVVSNQVPRLRMFVCAVRRRRNDETCICGISFGLRPVLSSVHVLFGGGLPGPGSTECGMGSAPRASEQRSAIVGGDREWSQVDIYNRLYRESLPGILHTSNSVNALSHVCLWPLCTIASLPFPCQELFSLARKSMTSWQMRSLEFCASSRTSALTGDVPTSV